MKPTVDICVSMDSDKAVHEGKGHAAAALSYELPLGGDTFTIQHMIGLGEKSTREENEQLLGKPSPPPDACWIRRISDVADLLMERVGLVQMPFEASHVAKT